VGSNKQDRENALTFMLIFARFEYALKRARFAHLGGDSGD